MRYDEKGDLVRWPAPKKLVDAIRVKLAEARLGFALLPKRWFVERFIAWAVRFLRLMLDYELLPQTFADLH